MSTLSETESAADALPLKQKKKLLEFLTMSVNGGQHQGRLTNLEEFAGSLRLSADPLAWQRRVRGENYLV